MSCDGEKSTERWNSDMARKPLATSPEIQDIGKFPSEEKGGYIFKQNF
jgi:hypothetical protein